MVNQACKGSGRVRDGAQQNGAKVAGSMREGEDNPELDQECRLGQQGEVGR